METALGILLFSVLMWVVAEIDRRLLRRGIQFAYIMPMTPKEEYRMLRVMQVVAIPVMVASAVYLTFLIGVVEGLASAGAGAAVLAGFWRRLRLQEKPPAGRHSS